MGILFDKLTEYGSSDFYPYHMPGHKRQAVSGFPQEILTRDITEIADFDNLHQPEGILLEAQRRAAAAYGAEESFYLVNGSTCGILSAVSAAVPFGGHLLIARNCHKSVYHAAYLRQLKLSYIYPELVPGFDICEAVTAQQVEAALQREAVQQRDVAQQREVAQLQGEAALQRDAVQQRDAAAQKEKITSVQAVLIVSPTYEGRIADIKAIAEVVHAWGLPLIVDEAHGAHLGFCEGFAVNSSRLGADLVINSVHKTLPAMTQTALLHCNGSLIDREILKRFLHIYQSSSPSYILMASIDHAVQTAAEGKRAFAEFRENWGRMLKQLEGLQKVKILPGRHDFMVQFTGVSALHDIGKLVISTKDTKLSGKQLADMLRETYHLEMEMACETYVLAMFTVADSWEGYERLTKALLEVDRMLSEGDIVKTKSETELEAIAETGSEAETEVTVEISSEAVSAITTEVGSEAVTAVVDVKPKVAAAELKTKDISGNKDVAWEMSTRDIPFCQAWDRRKRDIPLDESEGCHAGEFINLYPPGTPIAVPGEVISSKIIHQIKQCLHSGLEVHGVRKTDNNELEEEYIISTLI